MRGTLPALAAGLALGALAGIGAVAVGGALGRLADEALADVDEHDEREALALGDDTARERLLDQYRALRELLHGQATSGEVALVDAMPRLLDIMHDEATLLGLYPDEPVDDALRRIEAAREVLTASPSMHPVLDRLVEDTLAALDGRPAPGEHIRDGRPVDGRVA